jgi:hypothetical protein
MKIHAVNAMMPRNRAMMPMQPRTTTPASASLLNTLLLLYLRDSHNEVTLLADHEVVCATAWADLNFTCRILPHRQNVAFL